MSLTTPWQATTSRWSCRWKSVCHRFGSSKPGDGIVEHHFLYKREPKIWYRGFMDWHGYDPGTQRLKVLDHKTSLDPQSYGLVTDPEHDDQKALRDDHQGIIYARAGLDMYPEADTVDLVWSYGKSDGVRKHSYTAHAHLDD